MTVVDGETDEGIKRRSPWKSIGLTVLYAFFIAYFLRVFVFQPFTIPSESMEPNLIAGDYVIASKYSVGYGKYSADPLPFPSGETRIFKRGPERGDIVVFKSMDGEKRLIKRVVGLPGDKVQIISDVLYINGKSAILVNTDLEGPLQAKNFGMNVLVETFTGESAHLIYKDSVTKGAPAQTFSVPDNYYFMMGDNRDHSVDSRSESVGFIPSQNIIGKAEFILFSAPPEFSILKPWTWNKVRSDRLFMGLQ